MDVLDDFDDNISVESDEDEFDAQAAIEMRRKVISFEYHPTIHQICNNCNTLYSAWSMLWWPVK